MNDTRLTYAEAGVDISAGERASKAAYTNAKTTFSSRKGMIGEPLQLDGGFAGALDFGDFLLIQNDDGTGTKSEIAERCQKYNTLGEDLLAMVADDAICVGAECVSVTNTFDVPFVNEEAIQQLTASLAKACREQKIVIPGGEIAEVPGACTRMIWNATAVGIVKKNKFLTGKNIKPGQAIIGLAGRVLRSNGVSLARKICEKNFGESWHSVEWNNGITWGEILLTPSKIFHRSVLNAVLGGFSEDLKFNISGIVHITGGGIPGNVPRILPSGVGATFHDLHSPHEALAELKTLGNVDDEEAYRVWHSGTAMMIVCEQEDVLSICDALNAEDSELQAKKVGDTTDSGKIKILSKYSGVILNF
jgi:phosphoribosylformylglycinamidine cyclo-ligase